MKILTITLNPAYDVHTKTTSFIEGQETFVDIISYEIGGKALNISKALKEVGILTDNVLILGDENSDFFLKKMNEENLKYYIINSNGRIRENITIHSKKGIETRISFNGHKVQDNVLDELKNIIGSNINGDTYIVFAGSNPIGLDKDKLIEYISSLKERSAKIFIDSKSFSLEDLFKIKPFLIKPNEQELMTLYGLDVIDDECIKSITKKLSEAGIENVLVTLGEKGAYLRTNNAFYKGIIPKIDVLSTIGAGDSTIAGFIYALINKKTSEEALKEALSFGTSKCLRSGSLPPKKEDIEIIKKKISIEKM